MSISITTVKIRTLLLLFFQKKEEKKKEYLLKLFGDIFSNGQKFAKNFGVFVGWFSFRYMSGDWQRLNQIHTFFHFSFQIGMFVISSRLVAGCSYDKKKKKKYTISSHYLVSISE